MGHLLNREWLRDRLRLRRSASYRLIGGTATALINSDAVLTLLNRSRRGPQPVLAEIPSDICTAEELIAAIPSLAECGVTPALLLAWTHRTKNPPPHFVLTSKIRRFRRSQFTEWLEAASSPKGAR